MSAVGMFTTLRTPFHRLHSDADPLSQGRRWIPIVNSPQWLLARTTPISYNLIIYQMRREPNSAEAEAVPG